MEGAAPDEVSSGACRPRNMSAGVHIDSEVFSVMVWIQRNSPARCTCASGFAGLA